MDLSRVLGVRWVHLYEEDTPGRTVFRPDAPDLPLSRRPRRQLVLDPGGGATLFSGGPDDRLVRHPGAWRADGDVIVVTCPDAGVEPLRLVDVSAARLIATP